MSDETIAKSPLDETSEPQDAMVVDAEAVEPAEAVGTAQAFEPAEAADTAHAFDAETVDAVPVLAEARPLAPAASYVMLPAVQAAAVAATGFVAGAATVALVRRHTSRKIARSRSTPRRAVDMLPIVGSRTFLVDVHLLAKPGE